MDDQQRAESETTTLYRPVGEKELALIAAAGYRVFPPRLKWQPIFYPVLTEDYATAIARDWNAHGGRKGYVTRFEVETRYLNQFEPHLAGARIHREYWIPAERLAEFNAHIVGPIEVIATFTS